MEPRNQHIPGRRERHYWIRSLPNKESSEKIPVLRVIPSVIGFFVAGYLVICVQSLNSKHKEQELSSKIEHCGNLLLLARQAEQEVDPARPKDKDKKTTGKNFSDAERKAINTSLQKCSESLDQDSDSQTINWRHQFNNKAVIATSAPAPAPLPPLVSQGNA